MTPYCLCWDLTTALANASLFGSLLNPSTEDAKAKARPPRPQFTLRSAIGGTPHAISAGTGRVLARMRAACYREPKRRHRCRAPVTRPVVWDLVVAG